MMRKPGKKTITVRPVTPAKKPDPPHKESTFSEIMQKFVTAQNTLKHRMDEMDQRYQNLEDLFAKLSNFIYQKWNTEL